MAARSGDGWKNSINDDGRTLRDDEKWHASFNYRTAVMGGILPGIYNFYASYNKADFYDLFGPTKRSRKGLNFGVSINKSLFSDAPKSLDLNLGFMGYYGLNQSPEFQQINFENKEARQWALDVTKYWIENFDIDGWRMDVAKELDFSFWKEFRDIAHGVNKDTLLISEIFGDTSQWLQGDRFDGTMNYSFRESMTDYFATKRLDNKEFADSLAYLYSMYSFEALSSCQNLLSSHDVKRFLNRCGNDVGGLLGAIFMQATFPGIAGIYYGDEIGLGGADDPFNREPFPWDDKKSWNLEILDYTKSLMSIKKTNSIFKFGRFELVDDTENFVAFRRILKDESMLCIVNREAVSYTHLTLPTNREV